MSEAIETMARDDMALQLPLDDGVQLIEASAGTGKTFTIAGLYARLVVERQLELRHILVMTFTRAATDELRQRLRQRLSRCAELAASPWLDAPPDDEELDAEATWTLALLHRALDAGEDRAALAKRLQLAVLGMDEAAIVTIHGFCQRVLREHAALVDGASSDAELEPDDGDLLEDFAADAWLRIADDGDVLLREALPVLADTPDALAEKLKALVAFAGDIEPISPMQPLPVPISPDTCREHVFAAWAKGAEEAVTLFAQAHAAGHFTVKAFDANSVKTLQDMAQQLQGRFWPSETLLQTFAASTITDGLKKRAPEFVGHPAFDAIESWWQTRQAWQAAVRARIPLLLHRLVNEARIWLVRRKRALSRLSYDDQITLVHAGLCVRTRHALLDALRRQYPVALVDEFQDTDARQFDIFARLYADFGTLFCIGDPKQAIYGFRGGDVHAYLRARKLAKQDWHLKHNFRSAPGVLHAHAALFKQPERHVFIEDGIGFDDVAWGGKTAADALCHNGKTVSPMTWWQLPDVPIKGGKDATRDWLAMACAAEVARLLAPGASTLNGEPLQPKHVAVLVNSNAEAMSVQDALAARGVPAVCLRRESVYASPEAAELRQILDALLVPRHVPLARGALATHLLGCQLDDLKTMQDDDLDWHAVLDDLRQRWFERGILAMIERLGEQHAERLLSQTGGERCLSNLMQLGDAMQAQARRLATPHAQRDWLAERIAEADEFNEDEQLHLQSDAERVQILTLHASKGLEYELVFLPFAALMSARESKAGELARFHHDDRLVKRYLGSGNGDDATAKADQAAIAAALEEDKAEGVRKLYVGVTRAKHACWLSIGKPSSKFTHGVLDGVLPEGIAALAQKAADCMTLCDVPSIQAESLAPAVPVANPVCRRFDRVIDRDWWVHSFSRLSEGGHAGVIPVDAVAEVGAEDAVDALALSTGPRGPRFGSAVHAALEVVDFAAWAGASDEVPETQRRLIVDAMRAEGFTTDVAHEAAMRMLGAALCTPLFDDLSLATLPAAQRCAEMEFHFGIAGADPQALLHLLHEHGYQQHRHAFAHLGGRLAGLMNGLIDLTFVHQDRWWVVDYKTNHLGDHAGDYAPARLPAAIAANDYDLQYLIYTLALHRWLRQVRGADYDYERDFGGVCYLFLRGMGVGEAGNGIFRDRPPAALIENMDALLHAPGVAA